MSAAILISALLSFFMGMIWYSPKVFGTVWATAIGKTEKDLDKSPLQFLISFVGWLTAAFVYGFLISHPFIETIRDYILLSVALWGAFMLPAKAAAITYGNFSTKLLWIDGGYMLGGYIIFAFIFRLFT